jgi:hypothetical protein
MMERSRSRREKEQECFRLGHYHSNAEELEIASGWRDAPLGMPSIWEIDW